MKFKGHNIGMLKDLLKEIREMNRRLARIERVMPIEMLNKSDLKAIKKSEDEIRKGRYVTAEQLKRELGIK